MHWLYNILCPTALDKVMAFWTAIAALGAAIAAIGAIIAAIYSCKMFRAQTKQMQTDLWRSITQEFDHDCNRARSKCGELFLSTGKLNMEASLPILDFFETLGYLVRNSLIDEKLTHDTFCYHFAGYFMTTLPLIRKDKKDDPKFYTEIIYLHSKWGDEPSLITDDDLRTFFKEETERNE